jgi:hypothetical protein
MTQARSVGANFTIQRYTLTVTAPTHGTVSGTGITCGTGGSDCTETYDYGTVVALTATPDTGHPFRGWTGACSGKGLCSVTLHADTPVGAAFANAPPRGSHRDPSGFVVNTLKASGEAAPDATAGSTGSQRQLEGQAPVAVHGLEPSLETAREPAPAPTDVVRGSTGAVPVSPPPGVTVGGQVRSPGTYAWFPGMTARQLIAAASGLAPGVSDSQLETVRSTGDQTPERIEPDEPLEAGETLVVGHWEF